MRRWKRFLFYGLYLTGSVVTIILLMELALSAAYAITKDPRLDTFKENGPSEYPEEDLTIAIFGGSSAAGFASDAPMDQVLDVALRTQYPGLTFHIDNLAQAGYAFHRHQAELLKSVIDRYDIFLVYAGHNEAQNYLDDSGYFRDEDHKDDRQREPFGDGFNLIEWLENNSRIFAITEKIHVKYIQSHLGPTRPSYIRPRLQAFEAQGALPPEEIRKIYENFEADLREIGGLAEGKGKTIIVSSVPSHEGYAPLFSVRKPGLGQEELAAFGEAYQRGLEMYEQNNLEEAAASFLTAAAIDGRAAALNYYLGHTYIKMGDVARGREHIQRSIDNDGLPVRSLSALNQISESVARDYPSVQYVDPAQRFREVLDSGISNDELFADFQHPSLMGHIVIAHEFLREMSKLEPFNSWPAQEEALNFDNTDPRSQHTYYYEALGVLDSVSKRTSFQNARMHYLMSEWRADPASLLIRAVKHIEEYYEKTSKTPEDQALRLMFLAVLSAQRTDRDEAVDLVNQARQTSPALVQDFLFGEVIVDGRYLTGGWVRRFKAMGLDFAGEKE